MEEPNALIRWTVFIFAGGDGALLGAGCLAAVVILALSGRNKPRVSPLIAILIVSISLMLIVCGSLVMPIWFQVLSWIWLVLALSQWRKRGANVPTSDEPGKKSSTFIRRVLYLYCPSAWILTLIAIESPNQFWLTPNQPVSTVLVIADSVTAGLNDNDDTWPHQLSHMAHVEILDASQPGATLRSARQQNSLLSGQTGLLILEIGGNDLLEGLPVAQFERDLEQLLAEVILPGRSIVMFELPLPPLCAAYGVAQRRQAAKYGVSLIPKRRFASVITTSGATVDGIHLSASGQTKMMELVKSLLATRLVAGHGEYRHVNRR